jgi:hypothetical protein
MGFEALVGLGITGLLGCEFGGDNNYIHACSGRAIRNIANKGMISSTAYTTIAQAWGDFTQSAQSAEYYGYETQNYSLLPQNLGLNIKDRHNGARLSMMWHGAHISGTAPADNPMQNQLTLMDTVINLSRAPWKTTPHARGWLCWAGMDELARMARPKTKV